MGANDFTNASAAASTALGAPEISGVLTRFLWRSEEEGNDFIIAVVATSTNHGSITVKGKLPNAQIGISYRFAGKWNEDRFGLSLVFSTAARIVPNTVPAVSAYLLTLPGIGLATAKKIVGAWGIDAIEALKNRTAREIRAVAPKLNEVIIEEIREQITVEEKDLAIRLQIRSFLGSHGSDRLVDKILKTWGKAALQTIQENPWVMADEIRGVGFLTADEIALENGCVRTSASRVRAAILYEIDQLRANGHTVHDIREVTDRVSERLRFDSSQEKEMLLVMTDQVEGLVLAGRLCLGGATTVMLAADDGAERAIWQCLDNRLGLTAGGDRGAARVRPFREPSVESNHEFVGAPSPASSSSTHLMEDQLAAFLKFKDATTTTMVLTGPPGTGKTWLVKTILDLYRNPVLCAPTGKAARRLSELTGQRASTIHRLLEPEITETRGKIQFAFTRCREYPLEGDLVVVDEASMVDVNLAEDLLSAIKPETDLLLVGDHYQLPSVGPGAFLRDLLECGRVPAAELTKIKRQNPGRIVLGCHAIKAGSAPQWSNDVHSDLNVVRATSDAETVETIVDLFMRRLKDHADAGGDPIRNIQILMPFRAAKVLSAETVNNEITLRRRRRGEVQEIAGARFGIGEKVIQMKNDYTLNVVNGDIGRVLAEQKGGGNNGTNTSKSRRYYVIQFEGYDTTTLVPTNDNHLDFAYALTVHKSQGSEWPVVIIPVHPSSGRFFDRTLLYTAMSRASKRCVLVGVPECMSDIVRRMPATKRRTQLRELLAK